jgi:hypothetical protein
MVYVVFHALISVNTEIMLSKCMGTVSKVVRTGNAISNAGVIEVSSITLTIYTICMR